MQVPNKRNACEIFTVPNTYIVSQTSTVQSNSSATQAQNKCRSVNILLISYAQKFSWVKFSRG